MKKTISLFLVSIMLLALAGCGKSENTAQDSTNKKISITHDLGTVEIPYDAKKLVVLDLATLDIIDNLGLGDRVIGIPKSSSVSYLQSYVDNENIENVGSVKEVDMEAIYALKPDVIFIGGRLESSYDDLSAIAPVVLSTVDNAAGYMDTFKGYVNSVASIFGLEEKAQEKLSSFDERVAAINEAATDKNAIVGMVNSGSFSTLGTTSRCSMISNEAGFENIAADVDSTHGDSSSFELILEKDPHYIFILDRDSAIGSDGAKTAKEVMENEIVMKTSAYKNGSIVYLTPDVWYLAEGGITATDIMLQDIEAGIIAE